MKHFKFIFLFFAMLISNCKAGEFSIGLGYPYGAIRYGNGDVALEAKGAFGSGIEMYAGRIYVNFFKRDVLRLFGGVEGGYINFNDVYDISGKGWEAGPFLGMETFLTNWFSVAVDFAPTFIDVGSSGQNSEGLEYIINVAIYIFPFSKGKKPEKTQKPDTFKSCHKTTETKSTDKPPLQDKDLSSFGH